MRKNCKVPPNLVDKLIVRGRTLTSASATVLILASVLTARGLLGGATAALLSVLLGVILSLGDFGVDA